MDQWLKDYAKRRYGADNYAQAQEEIDRAWDTMHFSLRSWSLISFNTVLGNAACDTTNPCSPIRSLYPNFGVRPFALGMEPEIRPFVGQVPFMFPNQREDYYGSSSKAKMIIACESSYLP